MLFGCGPGQSKRRVRLKRSIKLQPAAASDCLSQIGPDGQDLDPGIDDETRTVREGPVQVALSGGVKGKILLLCPRKLRATKALSKRSRDRGS